MLREKTIVDVEVDVSLLFGSQCSVVLFKYANIYTQTNSTKDIFLEAGINRPLPFVPN